MRPLRESNVIARHCRRPTPDAARSTTSRGYYKTLMHGAHAMYRSSVEKSTKRTYKTAERRWMALTKRIGMDPFMRSKIPVWLAGDLSFANNTTITWEETCILASTRHKPNKLPPATAFNYLSAVRKFLQNGGVSTEFMDNSQYIRNTKAAMKIAYRYNGKRHCTPTSVHGHDPRPPLSCTTWKVHGNQPCCIHGGGSCIYNAFASFGIPVHGRR